MDSLKITQVQVDEIWSFIDAKAKNVPADADPALRLGDCYRFTAIDSETKLMPCWLVGYRTAQCANDFTADLVPHLANRLQLSTDGMSSYPEAVLDNLGHDVDFGVLNNTYVNDAS